MSTTIKDVAREAGVCIATVSRAFNEPDCVSQETLKRVHSAAKRLNYLPNALAKGLITHSTQTIGVLVPDTVSYTHLNCLWHSTDSGGKQ